MILRPLPTNPAVFLAKRNSRHWQTVSVSTAFCNPWWSRRAETDIFWWQANGAFGQALWQDCSEFPASYMTSPPRTAPLPLWWKISNGKTFPIGKKPTVTKHYLISLAIRRNNLPPKSVKVNPPLPTNCACCGYPSRCNQSLLPIS